MWGLQLCLQLLPFFFEEMAIYVLLVCCFEKSPEVVLCYASLGEVQGAQELVGGFPVPWLFV